jgi:protein phosphatase
MDESAAETTETDALKAISGLARTDIGRRREENQDSYGIIENSSFKLFSVADGMGGVKGGAIASSLAVNIVREMLGGKEALTPEDLQTALHAVNLQIYEKGIADPSLAGMGTTYVGLAFSGTQMFITNVGDSRAYRVRGGAITRLTEDHTVVTELVRSGAITPEQAHNHPVSHMLTRSLGPVPEVLVDCWLCEDGPYRDDRYVMCSDGLYNLVDDDEILSIIETNPLENALEMLIDLANERGGTDNITVVAVEIGAAFPVVKEEEEEKEEEHKTNGEAPAEGDEPRINGDASSEEKREAEGGSPLVKNRLSFNSFQSAAAPQQAVESPPPAPSPPHRTARSGIALGFVIGACVAAGAAYFGFSSRSEQMTVATSEVKPASPAPEAQPAPSAAAPQAAQAVAEPAKSAQQPTAIPAIQSAPPSAAPESAEGGGGGDSAGLMAKRRETLQAQLADLQVKIDAFDKPLSGDAGKILSEAASKREKLQNQLNDAMSKMDGATRRLAIWYGRRKRLGDEDPINMASEIAVSSDDVKKKKEEFDTATWSYLKEFEVLSYNPNDEQQKAKVRDLVQERRRRAEALTLAVKGAIELAVSDADQYIAELTVERSQIENDLGKLKGDVDFVRVLTGNDVAAKQAKKAELEQEREVAQAELAELNRANPQDSESASAPQ